MKSILLFLLLSALLISCQEKRQDRDMLLKRIRHLEQALEKNYTPGFGEFMNNVQLHHAKLWFAGINNNWPLAEFEVHELDETIEDIGEFHRDRPECKSIVMIEPAIDSVAHAVSRHDQAAFRSGYNVLTNTCNDCHRATEHAFNVITIPARPPVTNQRFERE